MISYQYPSKQHSFAWNYNTFSFHPEHAASGVCHTENHKPKPWKSQGFGKLMPLLAAGMAWLNSSGLFSKLVWLLKPDACDRSLWDGCGSGGWTSREKSTSCGCLSWGFADQAGRDSYPLGRQTLMGIVAAHQHWNSLLQGKPTFVASESHPCIKSVKSNRAKKERT